MTSWKARNRIPVRALIAAAIAVALAACNAQVSTSSTAVPRPSAAPTTDLPEIVVTARAVQPGDAADDAARGSQDQSVTVPADLAESRVAIARKARVASGAPKETG